MSEKMSKHLAKTSLIFGLSLVAISLLVPVYAKAGNFHIKRIEDMQRKQAELINKGVKSGQLTRQENDQLLAEQRKIKSTERKYLADKQLSRYESNTLIKLLKAARQHIEAELHDQERRPKLSKRGRLHH